MLGSPICEPFDVAETGGDPTEGMVGDWVY